MKISSVSKKVLASALSAAMVVAFAPTVAFATPSAVSPAKYVSVTYDLNGATGSAAPSYQPLQEEGGKYYVAVDNGAGVNALNGYAFTKWFIDADGDGLVGEKETVSNNNGFIEVAADATAVSLKAAFAAPDITIATTAFAPTATYNGGLTPDTAAAKIDMTLGAGVANHEYVLTVKNPAGTVVGTKTFKGTLSDTVADYADLGGTHTVWFTDSAVSSDTMAALKGNLVAGEYVISLTDNGKEIVTKKLTLATITVKVGTKTETGLAQVKGNVDLTRINPIDNVRYNAYTDADGYYVGTPGAVLVKGDATYTAVEQATLFNTDPAYDAMDGTANDRHLTFNVNTGGLNAKYAVSVADPTGAVVYTGAYAGAYDISFDQTSNGARTSAPEKAGDYVVTATITEADGTVKTSKSKFTLTEVKVEAGEGMKLAAANTVTEYFTGDTTEAGLAAFVAAKKGLGLVTAKADFDGAKVSWALNGAAATSTNKAKAGEVNTLTATAPAVVYAEAVQYSVAKIAAGAGIAADKYILTVSAPAGIVVAVKGGANKAGATTIAPASDGKYDITGMAYVSIEGTDAKGVSTKKIELAPVANTVATNWKNTVVGGGSSLELGIGNGTDKWLAADGVKAAIAAGQASIDAVTSKYFAPASEVTEAEFAAYKGVYEAVVAEANAQLKAYENGALVVVGTKAYTMTAEQYSTNTYNVAKDDTTVANSVKANLAASNKATAATDYKTGIATLVATANTALKNATDSKLAATDIAAAQTVTDALKAAATAEAAEKALADYAALTDAQKKLVSAEALVAAQEVVAAAELKDAQDDAAVSKARSASKTVKAGKNGKTTKKQSVTLKKITSASGAKVTYKKSSGSSKVSVKSGKAYLAKGVKKGTYKATVKATCGTQTAKITVKFVVK